MSGTVDPLVRMADQITANQRHLSDDEAAHAVAEHLRLFWTPAMRRELADAVAAGTAEVSPVTRTALGLLRSGSPAPR